MVIGIDKIIDANAALAHCLQLLAQEIARRENFIKDVFEKYIEYSSYLSLTCAEMLESEQITYLKDLMKTIRIYKDVQINSNLFPLLGII